MLARSREDISQLKLQPSHSSSFATLIFSLYFIILSKNPRRGERRDWRRD
jgi:hypothetical protein